MISPMKIKFTELNSGYKGEKRTARFSPKTRAKIIIAAVLVLSFVTVFLLAEFGLVPLGAITAKTVSKISGDEKNFPISVNTDSTKNIKLIGENILVLTTENYTVYSPSGKEVYSKPHTYADPAVSIDGKRGVVFDRSGTGFALINDKKEVYSGEAENNILTACYGENGNYSLATYSDNATSELSVYDKNNSLVFKWQSNYDRIGAVTLSDDGNYAGVAALGAENGDIYSNIVLFGFDYNEPLNTQKVNGAAVLDIMFTGGTELTAVSNDGVYKVKKKSDIFEISKQYFVAEFSSYSRNAKGKYAIALAKYGSANLSEITVFRENGKERTAIKINTEISDIYLSNKYVFALAQGEILVYNLSGGKVSSIDINGEAYSLLATDDFVFIPSLDNISRCYSFGEKSVDLTKN